MTCKKGFIILLIIIISGLSGCKKPEENIVKDVDGNIYHSVVIGSQVWMVENMRTTKYSDMTPVQGLTRLNEADHYSVETYGMLYTWSAAMKGAVSSNSNPSRIQGVCPTDWHIPSESEWKELTEYLGGDTIAGGKMKEAGFDHWNEPNSGATNASGFTGLPGGRIISYYPNAFRYSGWWWSSTEEFTMSAKCILLTATDPKINFSSFAKEGYMSVRCIRDY